MTVGPPAGCRSRLRRKPPAASRLHGCGQEGLDRRNDPCSGYAFAEPIHCGHGGLLVRVNPLALQRWRQVEHYHYHIRLVMSENGGNVVPADRVRPRFEKGFEPGLLASSDMASVPLHSEDEQRSIDPDTSARTEGAPRPIYSAVTAGLKSTYRHL
jgi:hypothetical protein